MSNAELWDSVSKTDPDFTKKVNARGGFTSVDAYYQIQCATEKFGPVGVGWGWSVVWDYGVPGTVSANLIMWHSGDRGSCFDVTGAADLAGKPKQDSDAKKKALTDAITKGLSYLGFNADVFLGKFDDNKYVESLRREKGNGAKKVAPGQPTGAEQIAAAVSLNELQTVWELLTPAQHKELAADKDRRKAELTA